MTLILPEAHVLFLAYCNETKLPVSPQKELTPTARASTFMAAIQGMDGSANHLALLLNGACIHQSNRNIANKDAVFKWAQEHPPPPNSYIHRLSTEETGKNAHLPVSP